MFTEIWQKNDTESGGGRRREHTKSDLPGVRNSIGKQKQNYQNSNQRKHKEDHNGEVGEGRKKGKAINEEHYDNMSSDGSSSSSLTTFASDSDVDIQEGLKIVGIVMVFLFILMLLRVCCIVFIDVAILRDFGSLMRIFSEFRRTFCPWWHPRTQPEENDDIQEAAASGDPEVTVISIDDLLVGLTQQQKQELLASILSSKVVCEVELEKLKSRDVERLEHDIEEDFEQTKHEVVCPICINPIELGSHVVDLDSCMHIFHKDCLSQWLSTHTRDCPYCRTEILSQEMIDEAYRIREEEGSDASEDDRVIRCPNPSTEQHDRREP